MLNTTWQGADGPVDWLDYDRAVLEFTADHGHKTKTADIDTTRLTLVEYRALIGRIVETIADQNRGGRRRWCSMSTCGNRAKAKRHYNRSTPGPEPRS